MDAIKKASLEVQLIEAGWTEKHGFWTHPSKLYQGKSYLFSFEQACTAEGLGMPVGAE